MGQTKTAMIFLNKRPGWKTTFLADEPILCPNGCKDNKHRMIEVIKRGKTYAASYQGQEDVDNVICDVLRLFDAPMCPECEREMRYIYFPCRTEQPVLAEPEAEPEPSNGDPIGLRLAWGVSLVLSAIVLLVVAQCGH